MHQNISVIMLTKNSSLHLRKVLQALEDFDEVVILDNGSSDDTIDIAKTFDNVILFKHDFIGFGPLKNLTISKAKNDWIFSVDSDEIISLELVNEISNMSLDDNTIYAISRDNYYNEKIIKCCGWENDFVNRIFNKNHTKFNNKIVHESLITKNLSIKKMKHGIKHYSFKSIEELVSKMQHYSTLYAKEKKGTKKSSISKAVSRSLFAFIKSYIIKKGFLYGYEGLVISVSNANGVFYKYMKLLEKNKS